jgi:hypothetical protein
VSQHEQITTTSSITTHIADSAFLHRLETHLLCHYAHIDDLESTQHPSAEVRDWLLQRKLQLVRQYKSRGWRDFAPVAAAYARMAAERMEQMQGIDDGRRPMGVGAQRTFEEAKKWEQYYPRPQSPTLPGECCGGGSASPSAPPTKPSSQRSNPTKKRSAETQPPPPPPQAASRSSDPPRHPKARRV